MDWCLNHFVDEDDDYDFEETCLPSIIKYGENNDVIARIVYKILIKYNYSYHITKRCIYQTKTLTSKESEELLRERPDTFLTDSINKGALPVS